MNTTPPIPCPVCADCDHDIRSSILELGANIMENLKAANEKLLDAVEAEDDGAAQFIETMRDFTDVREQITAILDTVPELAMIKAANVGD